MKSYKTNIKPKYFYAYLVLIFLFVMIFSISFLINQIINKERIISDFIKNKDQLGPVGSDSYNEAYNKCYYCCYKPAANDWEHACYAIYGTFSRPCTVW